MQRRQNYKLSSLHEEQIEKELDNLTLDDLGTDNGVEGVFDSDNDVCDPIYLPRDEDNEVIDRVVSLSDSDLVAEIGLSMSEINASVLDTSVSSLSTSSSVTSGTPRALKRIRLEHAEESIIQTENIVVNDAVSFSESITNIDPKSQNFKKILWRQKNLMLDQSAVAFCEPELGEDLKKLDTPYNCFIYFLDDTILDHIVRLVSTYVGNQPFQNQTDSKTTASRYVRSEKKYVDVDCPNIINEYNSIMGGVDLMDGLIGRYKITMKSNKYTNRIFYHLLDVAMVNAYILRESTSLTPVIVNTNYRISVQRLDMCFVHCKILRCPNTQSVHAPLFQKNTTYRRSL